MRLSVREVRQLAERSFSAAGFSRGVARANAATIWWTEAYRRTGIEMLYALLDELPELDRSNLTLCERRGGLALVDGGGQPALVAATPAVDLACAGASKRGIGVAYATIPGPDRTLLTLGRVTSLAVERGYRSIVLYTDGEDVSGAVFGTRGRPHPLVAEADLPAPPAAYVDLVDGIDADRRPGRDLLLARTAFGDADAPERHAVDDARTLDRFLGRSATPSAATAADATPGFVVICVDPTHPVHSAAVDGVVDRFVRDEAEERLTTVFRPEAIADRIETLQREGVAVEREVWRSIFEFSNGILAPPFEGSEKGAGFGLNELDG